MAESEDRIEFLLVEDDEHDVTAIKRAWADSRVPHRLLVVPGGETCLRFLKERIATGENGWPQPPLVVLLDDRMASMGGVETLKNIREDDALRHIPVLMLMATDETYRELKTYRMGANAYIVKPMGVDRLKEAIEIIVRFWELAELPGGGR